MPESKNMHCDVLYVLLSARQPYLHLTEAVWTPHPEAGPYSGTVVGRVADETLDFCSILNVTIDQFETLREGDSIGDRGAHRLIVLTGNEAIDRF